jgi:hypothetical protein
MKKITWTRLGWYFVAGLVVSFFIVSKVDAAGITAHYYNGDGGGPPSYLKYKIPGTDVSCCTAADCKIATKWHYDKKSNDYMVWIDELKVYYRVPLRRMIFDNVKDVHICYRITGTPRGYQVYCVILPQGSM